MRYLGALAVLLAAMATLVGGVEARAGTVTVTYTGDNVVEAFYKNGAAPVSVPLGANPDNWRAPDTTSLTLSNDASYQFIFRVRNDGNFSSDNPAGFLAQISGDIVGGLVVSDTSWEVAPWTGSVPTDFSTLAWTDATSWGTNGGSNIWTNVNGKKPLTGISTSAHWLWTDKNFAQGNVPEAWFRASVTTTAVPLPPAALAGFGLLGLLGAIRRIRRRRT